MRKKVPPLIYYSNPLDGFTPFRVFRIIGRLRQRQHQAIRHENRKQFSRRARTWTDCSQASVMKLRYRFLYPPEMPDRSTDWELLIAHQKKKWAQRMDDLQQWRRREFFILEKLNEGRFERKLRLEVGSVWAYFIDAQTVKMKWLLLAPRRRPGRRRYWSECMWKARFRFPSQHQVGSHTHMSWRIGILGLERKVYDMQRRNFWEWTVYNCWRKEIAFQNCDSD